MSPDDAQNVKNNKSKGLQHNNNNTRAQDESVGEGRGSRAARRATQTVAQSNGSFSALSLQARS